MHDTCNESAVVILGFQIGIGAVFGGDIRDLAAARKRREGDKMFQNEMGNLALFCGRQQG